MHVRIELDARWTAAVERDGQITGIDTGGQPSRLEHRFFDRPDPKERVRALGGVERVEQTHLTIVADGRRHAKQIGPDIAKALHIGSDHVGGRGHAERDTVGVRDADVQAASGRRSDDPRALTRPCVETQHLRVARSQGAEHHPPQRVGPKVVSARARRAQSL